MRCERERQRQRRRPCHPNGLTAQRAETYDDVVAALETIVERAARDGDRNGYFAAMYARRHGHGALRAAPRALRRRRPDGAVRHRLRPCATSTPHAAWRAGEPCSESWQVAFRAAARWRPIILQHLLLGMNAHINLDLGVAAAEIGDDGGLAAVRADFDTVNDVLGELVAAASRPSARCRPGSASPTGSAAAATRRSSASA